jgi:integrase
LPEVISENELIQILKVTDNIKHKAIIVILYLSGIRRGELIKLRIKDINFDKKNIFVRAGKGKKDRTTILADHAALALNKYLKLYSPILLLDYYLCRSSFTCKKILTNIGKVKSIPIEKRKFEF